ncbi:Uncharacterised protein [uncultured archaeon]|nr:Uncharacterised protein [uncultured archaeon]
MIWVLLASCFISGCISEGGENVTSIANPAAAYCLNQSGRILVNETAAGQAVYCVLADGRVCEEWSFYISNGRSCVPLGGRNDTSSVNKTGGFCGRSTEGACRIDGDCVAGGCSGQICQSKNDEPLVSTCEYRECYNAAAYGLGCRCENNSCRWAQVNGSLLAPQHVTPSDKDSCVVVGGKWGPMGLNPKPQCNLPTPDGGKECSGQSECVGACIAELPQELIGEKLDRPLITKGRCTSWMMTVGCNAYVNNGRVDAVLCLD